MRKKPDESFRVRNDYLAEREETRNKKKKNVLIIFGVILAVIAIVVTVTELSRFVKYRAAHELVTAGQYERAMPELEELGGYRDCPALLNLCYLDMGKHKLAANEWDAAREYYTKAAQITGSVYEIQESYMKEGRTKRKAGDWDGAVEAFTKAGDYRDAREQIRETRIQQAQALTEAGDPEGAATILATLTDDGEPDETKKNQ